METLRVHIAELVIATDPAAADVTIADSISERAESKGLVIVAREIVADLEEAIRAKLEQFIGDPNIDVVIATGVAESAAASNALRPLVTQPVPGFTDLFRWLAYQEIGASAMLSNAEAAQCTSTFVFVLPAVTGAVREAMDKLILPQLDPATKPKNLIQQIPRLASLVVAARDAAPATVEQPAPEAVPENIAAERTEAGPGISARLPAVSPGARAAQKSGPHVIRKEPAPDVTKQIDRSELERTLKRSESNDAVTKPAIDIRNLLPKLPPGADEDNDVGDTTDLTDIAAPAPLARVKLVPKAALRKKPATIQIPPMKATVPAGGVKTKTSEEITEDIKPVAVVRDQKSGGVKRVPPALQKKTPPPQDVVSLADLAREAGLDEPVTLAPKKPRTPTPAPVVERKTPVRIATEVSELDAAELEPATDEDFAKAEAASDELPTHKAAALASAAMDEAPTTAALPRKRPVTEPPPPPPKKRAPTEPPALHVPDKKPSARSARTPTEPPPPRDSMNDLPRGKFVYPVAGPSFAKRIAKWGALALLAAAAGIAFVHFFLTKPDEKKHVAVVVADAAVVAPPIDATERVGEVEPDAAIPEIEIDVPSGSAIKPQHATGNPHHPTGHPVAPPDAGVGAGPAAVATGSASTVAPEDPTCDEVSCVLEKYARPCCARYKPADSGFKPTSPGIAESLDKVQVKTGIEGVKPRVIACGEKFATKGTVSIAMTVGPEGTVKSATVADAPTPEIGNCVAQALRAASFAKTTKGLTFTYPFVF